MSKKRIIAIITVIVLLLAAGISVGIFLSSRGETQATDGNQVTDGKQPTDGTQTGENNQNQTTNPEQGNENADGTGDSETVDNENVDNNNTGNAGVTTDTNVNNVGETTITRVEEKDKLVSEHFLDWWKPMQVRVSAKTELSVKEPQLTVKKSTITGVGGDEFTYTGQNITYVIEVTNNGNEEIKNIEITDKIPQGTSFVTVEDIVIDGNIVAEGKTVETNNSIAGVKWVATIPAGKTVKARFTVKVTATEGTISNVAIANGEESTDPRKDPTDPDNETKTAIINSNKSSVLTRLNTETNQYDIVESKIAKVGDLITYTIAVKNTGDVAGTTFITDTIPTGTEFYSTPEVKGVVISETKNSIVWSIEVPAGETVSREFTVKVVSVDNGTIKNTAGVGGNDTTDPEPVKVEANIIFVENGGTEVQDMTGFAGEIITTTTMPETTRLGYTFKGWYDNSELTGNAVENLPEAYPVGTTYYYAKWEARTDLTGIVNYYLKDTTTKLAESKPLSGLTFGSSVSENAIEIAGYNKVEPTSATITVELEGNEINFYYTARTDLTGIVNYYLKDTTTKLAESKPLSDLTYKGTVTEKAIEIAGYNKVEPTSQTITVALEGNEINFYYTARTDLTGIVNYYLKDTTTKLAESKPLSELTFGSSVSENAIEIAGYNKVEPTSQTITVALEGNEINFYYTARTDLTGMVNYYLKDTTTKLAESKPLSGLTFGSSVSENAIEIAGYNKVEPTSATITVELEGNEINFYYTARTDLTGIVNYYLKDTTTKLAESKPLSGLTYKGTVTEQAIEIAGYNKVEPTSQTITVALEGNEINFYYTARTDLTGIVNYYLKDTTTKLVESKPLSGLTYKGTVTESAIEIAGYNKVEPTSQTITVELEGNEINFYYTPGNAGYTVEYYYQINGNYSTNPDSHATRTGTTGETANVTDTDKESTKVGYVFDEAYTGNVLSGTIIANGSLKLKVYFKQQYTVTYTDGVGGEAFENQTTPNINYGAMTPEFKGTPTRAGYTFVKWYPEVAEKVTADATYTAIWEALQVEKTRTEIVDADKLGHIDYVDQEGDIIKYTIKVTNIGDEKATGIEVKDSLDVKVISVKIAETEIDITNRTTNEFEANTNLLEGLTAEIEKGQSIEIIIEYTVTENELTDALASNNKQLINTATAILNQNSYTDTADTTVKQRCEYVIEYYYNNTKREETKVVATIGDYVGVGFDSTRTYNGETYQYVEYKDLDEVVNGDSLQLQEGINVIKVYYGKPETVIEKAVIINDNGDTATTSTVNAGSNIKYAITVKNNGYYKSESITVSDQLQGTTYVDGSAKIGETAAMTTENGQKLSWLITEIPARSEVTITFEAKVPNNVFGDSITNTANIVGGASSNTVTTTVNEVSVEYSEWKEGQKGTDLNIIFVLDNSQSMNWPIVGEEFADTSDDYDYIFGSYYTPVSPEDEDITRLYNAKVALNSFIESQRNKTNTDMAVVTFNEYYTGNTTNFVTLVKDEQIVDGKVTIDGVAYNVSTDKIKGTDGKEYYYIYRTIPYGARLVGSTATSNINELKALVSGITISSERSGFGTYISPALNMIANNSDTYLKEDKKNVVIVLADGDFSDSSFTTARNNLLTADPNLEIYTVGFGDYNETRMINLSTNSYCYSATDAGTILGDFNEILSAATGDPVSTTTEKGLTPLVTATDTIKVSAECPIVATYATGEVDSNGKPVMATLFECKTEADMAKYGITISEDGKSLKWNAKIYIANTDTPTTTIVPSTVYIKYYIPPTTTNTDTNS